MRPASVRILTINGGRYSSGGSYGAVVLSGEKVDWRFTAALGEAHFETKATLVPPVDHPTPSDHPRSSIPTLAVGPR
jgi:hypothetical protein